MVVSTVVVVFMGEVSAVVVSMEEVSVAALSAGEAFVVVNSVQCEADTCSAAAASTGVAFVVGVLVAATSVAIFAITDSLMMSSSAASAFQGGGAGAIRTDITVTTITRTITMAMDTAGIRTVTTVAPVMDMAAERVMDIATAVEPVMDTALAADQGIPGVSGGGNRPGYGL